MSNWYMKPDTLRDLIGETYPDWNREESLQRIHQEQLEADYWKRVRSDPKFAAQEFEPYRKLAETLQEYNVTPTLAAKKLQSVRTILEFDPFERPSDAPGFSIPSWIEKSPPNPELEAIIAKKRDEHWKKFSEMDIFPPLPPTA